MITVFDDVSFVQAMLDFECALSAAEAENGVIEDEAAEIIGSCCDVLKFDLTRLSEEAVQHGTVVIPLVRQLTQLVAGKDKNVSGWVHFGATSQDVVDTGLVLRLRDAIGIIRRRIRKFAKALGNSSFNLQNYEADLNSDPRKVVDTSTPKDMGVKHMTIMKRVIYTWDG